MARSKSISVEPLPSKQPKAAPTKSANGQKSLRSASKPSPVPLTPPATAVASSSRTRAGSKQAEAGHPTRPARTGFTVRLSSPSEEEAEDVESAQYDTAPEAETSFGNEGRNGQEEEDAQPALSSIIRATKQTTESAKLSTTPSAPKSRARSRGGGAFGSHGLSRTSSPALHAGPVNGQETALRSNYRRMEPAESSDMSRVNMSRVASSRTTRSRRISTDPLALDTHDGEDELESVNSPLFVSEDSGSDFRPATLKRRRFNSSESVQVVPRPRAPYDTKTMRRKRQVDRVIVEIPLLPLDKVRAYIYPTSHAGLRPTLSTRQNLPLIRSEGNGKGKSKAVFDPRLDPDGSFARDMFSASDEASNKSGYYDESDADDDEDKEDSEDGYSDSESSGIALRRSRRHGRKERERKKPKTRAQKAVDRRLGVSPSPHRNSLQVGEKIPSFVADLEDKGGLCSVPEASFWLRTYQHSSLPQTHSSVRPSNCRRLARRLCADIDVEQISSSGLIPTSVSEDSFYGPSARSRHLQKMRPLPRKLSRRSEPVSLASDESTETSNGRRKGRSKWKVESEGEEEVESGDVGSEYEAESDELDDTGDDKGAQESDDDVLRRHRAVSCHFLHGTLS